MNDTEERLAIIDWIERAMKHAQTTRAALGKVVWPADRSIIGKVLSNKRRAQIGELAQIAVYTGYPPYIGGAVPPPKTEPSKRRPVVFHIREWREHSEVDAHKIAKAIGMEDDLYEAYERRSHKFTIEQIQSISKVLKVDFDTMRFPPPDKGSSRSKQNVARQTQKVRLKK